MPAAGIMIRAMRHPPAMPLSAVTALLLVAALCSGCNVIAWQQRRLEHRFRDAGFKQGTVTLERGKTTVGYWAGGRGPAVLLIHGFGASAIWQWYQQIEVLAARHRVIVPDLLWFGASSSRRADHSLAHQVQAVVGLLDHLGQRRVHVVGISYGGLVAYELARAHPHRVERLVMVDSPGPVYTRADYKLLCARFKVRHIGEVLVPTDPAGVQVLMDLAYHDPDYAPAWVRRQVVGTLYSRYRREKVALVDDMLQDMGRLTARPITMTAPTLIVWGKQDPVFPLELAWRLSARLGGRARLEVIDRARHAPNLEHPEAFNRLVVPFLRAGRVRRPAAGSARPVAP